MGVFYLSIFWKPHKIWLFLKKKEMNIIIDKPDYVVVKTSYGYFTDDEGTDYPFSVEINETNGEQKWIEISWDDDAPIDYDLVEQDLMEIFVGVEK